MDIVHMLAEFWGAILVVVGVSVMMPWFATDVVSGIKNNRAISWFIGFTTFGMGMVSVMLYDEWTSNWYVIVPIIGWVSIFKGLMLTLVPASMMGAYERCNLGSYYRVIGIIAVVGGLALAYASLCL